MTARAGEMSWEILNAYVDGELDPAISAQVAEAAASDAATAARIFTLSKLKASAAGVNCQDGSLLPLPVLPKRARRSSRYGYAVAAGLALAACFCFQYLAAPPTVQTWLDFALGAQRQWLVTAARTGSEARSRVTIGATTATRPLDLSGANLSLVYVAPLSQVDKSGSTFLGYRGPHGCLVGLWIGDPQNGLGHTPQPFDVKQMRVRAWSGQNAAYAVIARGMDPVKIGRLADAIARLVDPLQIVNESVTTALRDVARSGAPCRA
jgi:hypothetical protein